MTRTQYNHALFIALLLALTSSVAAAQSLFSSSLWDSYIAGNQVGPTLTKTVVVLLFEPVSSSVNVTPIADLLTIGMELDSPLVG